VRPTSVPGGHRATGTRGEPWAPLGVRSGTARPTTPDAVLDSNLDFMRYFFGQAGAPLPN